MDSLIVLYDEHCAFCERCRGWLEVQPQRVPLRFLGCRSAEAASRFGGLPLGAELVVVDSGGRYWVGPPAFVMCLWALEAYEDLAYALADGWLAPLGEPGFALLSRHRGLIGRLIGAPCHDACGVEVAAPSPYR